MKCRLCRKEFKDGVGRFNDHVLLLDNEVTEAICTDCATNNPDTHHKAFLTATKGLNFAIRKGKPPVQRIEDVKICEDDLYTICNCKDCKYPLDEYCEVYRQRLVEKYPLHTPIEKNGVLLIPVMNGLMPKRLFDFYTDNIVERLKHLKQSGLKIHDNQKERLLWSVEELEAERRQLHTAMLASVGFTPMDCSVEAMAFKIVIEEAIAARCKLLGVI